MSAARMLHTDAAGETVPLLTLDDGRVQWPDGLVTDRPAYTEPHEGDAQTWSLLWVSWGGSVETLQESGVTP